MRTPFNSGAFLPASGWVAPRGSLGPTGRGGGGAGGAARPAWRAGARRSLS